MCSSPMCVTTVRVSLWIALMVIVCVSCFNCVLAVTIVKTITADKVPNNSHYRCEDDANQDRDDDVIAAFLLVC